MTQVKQFPFIGSISSGTMRTEDLIPAFLDVLEEIDPKQAKKVCKQFRGWQEDDEVADFFLEDLFAALDDHSPPYFYFGSLQGDGSDYGFWFSEDSFEEAVHAGEVVKVDDLSKFNLLFHIHTGNPEPECVAVVNDHGNVTLYSTSDLENPIWEIV